jgi:hypothetical protein
MATQRSESGWVPPHPDLVKVDTEHLQNGANLMKACHACNTHVWDVRQPGTQLVISKAVGGFFACSTCPVGKLARNSTLPAAYRKVFCLGCIDKYVPGKVDSCFESIPGGWRQKLAQCWHCKAGKCVEGCPRVAKQKDNLVAAALAAAAAAAKGVPLTGKRRVESVKSLPKPPRKRQSLPNVITSPEYFEEQAELLSQGVKQVGWFTPKPSDNFMFFLPEFVRKFNGTMEVGPLGFNEANGTFAFPRGVHWLPATETDGKARLHCPCSLKLKVDGTPPTCFHVRVLELLINFDKLQTRQPRVHNQCPDTQAGEMAGARVAIGGLDCYAVFRKGAVFLVGNHADRWFCQCKKCSR